MKLSEPVKCVRLPVHDIPKQSTRCFRCGEGMDQVTASMVYTYNDEKIRVTNIQLYRCPNCKENIYPASEAELIEDALKKASEGKPTFEAKPVKHGYWYLLDECVNSGIYCSVCHKKVYKEHYANVKPKSKFCPNCGATMDGEFITL